MTNDSWEELHRLYAQKDWVKKPSLFAVTVKDYLPKSGHILDLGAGLGQDSVYFSELGYQVTATDLNIEQLQKVSDHVSSVKAVDLLQRLPFDEAIFDVVYAHLSLHYFDGQTTQNLFTDIYRVLKPNGLLAFFTNSKDDPEYGQGTQIESDYFDIQGTAKRYLNVDDAKRFAHSFKPLLLDNMGETYKDSAKGVHNLIRFIGVKKS
ncbi:MAG TPA: methyltransferase domain-containing protein [Verrucomicrobiae bacterium]|nr:methyltransferase domain-containing protein [Verrucomicrobiae bacterium]